MPRKRQSLPAESSEEQDESNITITRDALNTLITSIQQTQAEFCHQLLREVRSSTPQPVDASTTAAAAAVAAVTKSTANFSRCSSRFSGSSNESVENFIDAIQVYKSCLNISDENALLNMSMLLTSSAGMWWTGVKGTTKTWDEAIDRLRCAYGERRPPFRIYGELFSLVQGQENTDLFISKVRALLASLPTGDLCERVELDMTFGLLDRRIRKRLDRNTVKTFDELLMRARAIEDSLNEVHSTRSAPLQQSQSRGESFRDGEAVRTNSSAASTSSRSSGQPAAVLSANPTNLKTANDKGKRIFCVYCKRNTHTKENCEKLLKAKSAHSKSDAKNTEIKCYGCGAANVIRSKCTTCNPNNNGPKNEHSAFYSAEFSGKLPDAPEQRSRGRHGNECLTHKCYSPPPPTAARPSQSFDSPAHSPSSSHRGSTACSRDVASASSVALRPSSAHRGRGNPAHVAGDSVSVSSRVKESYSVKNPYSEMAYSESIPDFRSQTYFESIPYDRKESYSEMRPYSRMDICNENYDVSQNICSSYINVPTNSLLSSDVNFDNNHNVSHVDKIYANVSNMSNDAFVCVKTKRCCTTCVQGELPLPSVVNGKSVNFCGSQSCSGNTDGSKADKGCQNFAEPCFGKTSDSKPFCKNIRGPQHFFADASDGQHFEKNVRGSQHFFADVSDAQHFVNNINVSQNLNSKVYDSQHLCGITSGSQSVFGKQLNGQRFLRPVLKISILGENGTALLDSAAKSCVAGHTLYTLLKAKGHPMSSRMENVKLADGVSRLMKVFTTELEVTLQGVTKLVGFLIFPDADNNETLLGIDFLINFNIAVNFGSASWHFAHCPEQKFELHWEKASSPTSCAALDVLREDEAVSLSAEQREVLAQLITDNRDIFELKGEPTTFAEHIIDTGEHAPISVPPYRLTPAKKAIMQSEIDKMLSDDVIEECESACSSPALLIPKKNGQVRFCVDYRKLNAVTKTDVYPMPRIDELVQSTKRNCIMSTLDMRSGFWNVAVREVDRDKTAFVTPFGTHRFKRMPFGLKNAPSTFQRLIDRLRSGASLKNVTLLAYQDDLLIISEGFDQHIADLRAVFERLRLFNLRANREKCVLARKEVKYLGHVITQDGVSADRDKVRAVAEMKPPSSVRHLKTFLQTCSWFRKFILNFSEVAEPLTRLLKKDQTWIWGTEQSLAFQELKNRLTSAPILVQADYSKPFILRTDASSYALGAVLLQGEGKDERPVEYASRLLSPAERNYSTTEKEALAVVWSVERFRGYIEGQDVVVASDHQPLKWLLSLKSPSGRLVRWALKLQEFNIQLQYTPGRANVIADTMSRPICEDNDKSQCGICSIVVDLPTRSPADLRQAQLEDQELKKIIVGLESNKEIEEKRWSERGYFMQQGVLHRYNPDVDVEDPQLALPVSLRLEVLKECHDSPIAGHQGIDRTFHKLSQRYFFPGMRRVVADFIKSCATCQRYKSSNVKPSGLLQTPVLSQRGEVLAIDLFGPLPLGEKGERWILLVEDTATRWVELFALNDATSDACARTLIEEYFLRYGLPRRIVSDNGVQFVSSVMQQCMYILGIRQELVPLYHPEANPAERKNRDLKVQLAQLVDTEHTTWPEHLPAVRFAMNSAVCQTTGTSPAYLTLARELRSPVNVHLDIRAVLNKDNFVPQITPYLKKFLDSLVTIRDKVEKEQDRRKDYADKSRKDETFDIGSEVLIKSHVLSNAAKGLTAKFIPKRDGPYIVSKVLSPTTYQISKIDAPGDVVGRYHASQLTKFVNRDDTPPPPIVAKRNRGRPRQIQTQVSDVGNIKQVPQRGRMLELEGECVAGESVRELPLRTGRGKPPARYSPIS